MKFNIDEEDKIRSLKNKSCLNILRSIEKSKENEFSNVLFGLGIRYVGKTTAKKLAKSMKNIDAIIHCASIVHAKNEENFQSLRY